MNNSGKNKKKGVRKLGSDRDYLAAFLAAEKAAGKKSAGAGEKINRHGLPFVEDYETQFEAPGEEAQDRPADAHDQAEEDFAQLLADSFKENPPKRKPVKPVPLKKRLKRYPGPEADLDLHGFTAIGAEAKARSFIQTALHQGYFTLRIIVGKGTHSPDGPVLPHVVEDILKAMKSEKKVLSYEWEGGRRKNSGALIVYLNQFGD